MVPSEISKPLETFMKEAYLNLADEEDNKKEPQGNKSINPSQEKVGKITITDTIEVLQNNETVDRKGEIFPHLHPQKI